MVYLYRIWANNTRSFLGMFERVKADSYMKQMGGTFELIPIRVDNGK